MVGRKYRFAEHCEVRYDESGELLSGAFFEIRVQYDCDCVFGEPDETWHVVNITDGTSESYEPWVWAELLTRCSDHEASRAIQTCPISSEHIIRRIYLPDKVYIDVTGYTKLSDFVPGSGDQGILVSDHFRRRLESSGLTGIKPHLMAVVSNQSRMEDPQIYLLEFAGTIWERPLQIVGKPNACPNCGHVPLICPVCGQINEFCPQCHQEQCKLPKTDSNPSDTYLSSAGVPVQGRILMGRTWTGEDFVESRRSRFITKRVLDWLLQVQAKPFYARPARVDVEGMTEEQLRWLESAKQSLK